MNIVKTKELCKIKAGKYIKNAQILWAGRGTNGKNVFTFIFRCDIILLRKKYNAMQSITEQMG